jgi:hypothetical protein
LAYAPLESKSVDCGGCEREEMKPARCFAGAILAPLVVMSAELLMTRFFKLTATSLVKWYYLGLALSVVAGAYCLCRLPISPMKRTLLTIIFVPIALSLIGFYAGLFQFFVFGCCPN